MTETLVKDFLKTKDISKFTNFNGTFETLISQCSESEIGKFVEAVIKLSILSKIDLSTFNFGVKDQIFLIEQNQTATNIKNVSFGTKSSGRIDILGIEPNSETIFAFSSKIKNFNSTNTTTWSDLEMDGLRLIETKDGYKKFNIYYGAIVKDKNELSLSSAPSYIKELRNKVIIIDLKDVSQIFNKLIEVFSDVNFNNDNYNEYIRGERAVLDLMPHQVNAHNNCVAYFDNNTKNKSLSYLFNHLPRSGKSITCCYMAKKLNAKNILLLTHFPILNTQWEATINNYTAFEGWNVVNVSHDKIKEITLDSDSVNFVLVSLQDFKDFDKPKFKNFSNYLFDVIIIDEVHYGAETDKVKEALYTLQFKYVLGSSATPEKNLILGSFNVENTDLYDLEDEQTYKSVDARYTQFPTINWYGLNATELLKENLGNYFTKNEFFTWSKAFTIEDDEFKYKLAIYNFYRKMFGVGSDIAMDGSPILMHNPRSILITVDKIPTQEKLRELLYSIPTISDNYNIHITNSKLESNNKKLLAKMNSDFMPTKEKKSIIIVVDQCRVGVTLRLCDCVIHSDDTKSYANYIQTSYRCRTAGPGRKKVIVIDTLPSRMLEMYSTSVHYSHLHKKLSYEVILEKRLKSSPVQISNDGFNFVELDSPNTFIKQLHQQFIDIMGIKNFTTSGVITNFNSEVKDLVDNLSTFIKKPKVNDFIADLTGNGINTGKNKDLKVKITGKKTKKEKDPELKAQFLLSNWPWACILTNFKFNTYHELIMELRKNDVICEEFEMINKVDIETYIKIMDLYVVDKMQLNQKIVFFNQFAKENPEKIVNYLTEDDYSIQEYGDKYLTVAQATKLVDLIPDSEFTDLTKKFADTSSGSGSILIAIKNKLMKGLENIIVNPEQREKHIIENMIYAFEIQQRNVILSKLRYNQNGYSDNVIRVNTLTHNITKEFDVIVSFPPIKETDKFDVFFERQHGLVKDGGYIVGLSGPNWMIYNSMKNQFFPKMIKINQLEYLNINSMQKDFIEYSKHTCYFLYRKIKKSHPTKVECMSKNKTVISDVEFDIDSCIPTVFNSDIQGVFNDVIFNNRVKKFDFSYKKGHYQSKEHNDMIDSNELNVDNKHIYTVRVSHNQNTIKYGKPIKSIPDYNQFKVFISIGTGGLNPWYDSNCTGTHHAIYNCVDNEQQAKNLTNILKLKFYQFIIDVTQWSGFNTNTVVYNLPSIDLNQEWTNESLYKYLKLSDSQISIIESYYV